MLQINIHRGINQIGGCITEIATENTKIIIDLGQNLPDAEGNISDELANEDSVRNITNGVNAIFYTHYHGDHIGLFPFVPDNIKQYIGNTAKKVVMCKHKHLSNIKGREEESKQEIAKIEEMYGFLPEEKIVIGDITVTPYFVSHSACDAFMFLIETNGCRILHSGDFRGHGYLSKGTLSVIKKLILPKGNIDFLIIEGTMLSRYNEKVLSENELKTEIIGLMKKYKYVFAISSSTDMERLATFHAANKIMRGSPFVCDSFQQSVLKIFTETSGEKSDLFNFANPYNFSPNNQKLTKWMLDKGFCMLLRTTPKFNDYLDFICPQIDMKQSVLIYSMWKGYINSDSKHKNQKIVDFISRFPNIESRHTSGHASVDYLVEFCEAVNPTTGIIPIHSECSSDFEKLPLSKEMKEKIITNSKKYNEVISVKINNCINLESNVKNI